MAIANYLHTFWVFSVIYLTKVLAQNNKLFQIEESPPPFENLDVNSVAFGSCDHREISKKAQICETLFFKQLIQETRPNCRNLFQSMQQCMIKNWNNCFTTSSNFTFDGVRYQDDRAEASKSETYCNHGGLSLPSPDQPINYCLPAYEKATKRCVHDYLNKFTRNPGDRSLCGEYLKARECLYEAQDINCEYATVLKVVMASSRKLYRCWNPFCVWRRRPSRMRSLASYNYLIPKAEQRQGLPENCVANTAFVKIRNVGLKKYKTARKTKSSTTKDWPYQVNHIRNDPNISIVRKTFETRGDTTLGGGKNNLFSTPAGIQALLCFSALALLHLIL